MQRWRSGDVELIYPVSNQGLEVIFSLRTWDVNDGKSDKSGYSDRKPVKEWKPERKHTQKREL